VTEEPPVGAGPLSVMVQLVEPGVIKLEGAHTKEETVVGAGTSVSVAVCDAPAYEAVMVADWVEETAAAFAEKLALVAAAATVTDAGTVKARLSLDSVTAAPPAGAALVRVTVHALVAFGPRLEGAQANDDTSTGATRLIVALLLLPL
jgi:hypothetical protein